MNFKIKSLLILVATVLLLSACGADCDNFTLASKTSYDSANDIELSKSNSGIAQYAGSIRTGYFNKHGHEKDITEEATLIINFDNNTILYSGQIAQNSLNLEGTFDNVGRISGEAIFAGDITTPMQGRLTDLEMTAVFGNNCNYGGGIKAYRISN